MSILKKILVYILVLEARLIVKKYKPYVIAVTGSVGKTSTKDAIYDVLKTKIAHIRKSEKSLNSEIGLPLTIIGVRNAWYSPTGWLKNIYAGFVLIMLRKEYPECLVLEIGADHPRDIEKIAKWLKTDISVITKISETPVHVEFFNSPKDVFEEKAHLATALKSGGYLIVYGDEKNTLSLGDRVKDKDVSVISFGATGSSDIKACKSRIVYEDNRPTGFAFDIVDGDKTIPITLRGVLGETYAFPVLAGYAVAKAKGVSVGDMSDFTSNFNPPKGRMNILQGINGSVIIDDTYNSSPDAVLAGLKTLKQLETTGRKIAVLGDMLELGKYAQKEHRYIGSQLVGIADDLITVGPRSKDTYMEALSLGFNAGCAKHFDRSNEAAEYLSGSVKAGDTVFIKGSQSIRMERVTKALLLEPEKADKLLVRQEQEWLDKK